MVLRSGKSWSRGSHIQSNDGWFGGELSSDRTAAAMCSHSTTCYANDRVWQSSRRSDWALQYGNESLTGARVQSVLKQCRLHVQHHSGSCEYYDLSREEPELLAQLLERLKAYRATAVDSSFTTNVDGSGCRRMNAILAWTAREATVLLRRLAAMITQSALHPHHLGQFHHQLR